MNGFPRIDWTAAASVGGRAVPAGPKVTATEARDAVSGLRAAASTAADVIAERSGLRSDGRVPVRVLDRAGWVVANADMAEEILRVVVPHPRWIPKVARAAIGAQAGLALAAVSVRILGQFEGLSAHPRLLLVAPNAVAFERNSRIPPRDFRLWACLHEQTHQFQFGHAPWLRAHVLGVVKGFLGDGVDEDDPDAMGEVTAAMTFLEGHAEVQMDITAEGLIDSLPALRASLDKRRRSPGLLAVIQQVVGLNEKVTQYERGTVFCRRLYDLGGLELLNSPLSEPDLLPTSAEIDEPGLWLKRVG